MFNKSTQTNLLHTVLFFALTFLLSWSIWFSAGIFYPDMYALIIVGAWAPTISAILLTGFTDGRMGVRSLLEKLLKWRVNFRYYLFAIFGVLGIAIIAVFINLIFGGLLPELGEIAVKFGFPEDQGVLFLLFSPIVFITTIFVGGPIAEELGWRGYAQPRLQTKMGEGLAGLLIGFIWSLWHIPLFIYFPSATGNLPIEFYIPLISLFGILFAWLYNRTGGSVFLCILLHAGINFSFGVIGSEIFMNDSQLLIILILLTAATAFILYYKDQNFLKRTNIDGSI